MCDGSSVVGCTITIGSSKKVWSERRPEARDYRKVPSSCCYNDVSCKSLVKPFNGPPISGSLDCESVVNKYHLPYGTGVVLEEVSIHHMESLLRFIYKLLKF